MYAWRTILIHLTVAWHMSACTTSTKTDNSELILVNFYVAGAQSEQGIIAIAEKRFEYADIERLEESIRGEMFVGRPPRDIDACFYLSPESYGLVRLRDRTSNSFVLDVKKFPDAGLSFRISMNADGTVSGSRVFWSSGSSSVETAVHGHFVRTPNISACTKLFPTARS